MPNSRILIAEDDRSSGLILKRTLERAGYPTPLLLASAPDAILAADDFKPDIFIAHIGMPGHIDGIEAAQLIRQKHNTPIIFISSHVDKRTISRAKGALPAAYLLKPFKSEEIIIAIEIALHAAETNRELAQSQQQNKLYAEALAHISEAIIITDAKQAAPHILHVNKAFTQITGYQPTDVIGKPLTLLSGEKSVIPDFLEVQEQLMHTPSHNWETVGYKKDQSTFIAAWNASAVPDKNSEIKNLVFSLKDITADRLKEQRLQQSQKMEALGKFTGGIAHDFNNILAVINSYSDLLKLKLGPNSSYIKFIDNIRSAGERGTGLVSQLMTFTRDQTTKRSLIDISQVAYDCHKMLQRIIRSEIEIELSCEAGLPKLWANPSQIEQIIINLCTNSRDAISGSGIIRICISSETLKTASTKIKAQECVSIRIKDTGSGIEAKNLNKIFDPFYTTKDIGKGTGLGLSTVYGIVKQYYGNITVDSEPHKGSTFSITLPTNTPQNIDSMEQPFSGEKATILVVHSDNQFLKSLSGLLDLHSYKVHTASDEKYAINEFLDAADDIELLIFEASTPESQIDSILTEANPKIKCISVSDRDEVYYNSGSSSTISKARMSLDQIHKIIQNTLLKGQESNE